MNGTRNGNGRDRPIPGPELDILIGDRDDDLLENCRRILSHERHRCAVEGDPAKIRKRLEREKYDLVLLDVDLLTLGLPEVLSSLREEGSHTLLALMQEGACARTVNQALREGAWDLLAKPFGAQHLLALIERAGYTVHATLARHPGPVNGDIGGEAGRRGVPLQSGASILGGSDALKSALSRALAAARTDASVMLTGESGTGKELFARLIHERSPRAKENFVPVNCAALPSELLESEMFGHRRGAFTGASRDKEGLFEVADGGTIFLDELGEMPLKLQAKLLRVVEDGSIRRVGSERIERKVGVRIISATNRDPLEAVRDRALREDLYYRLRVVAIDLPPLRKRLEDIPILADDFLRRLWKRHRDSSEPTPRLSESAMDALKSHHWPGNVRELENVIGTAVIFAAPGKEVRPEHLSLPGAESNGVGGGSEGHWGSLLDLNVPYHHAKDEVLKRFERQYVTKVITETEGNLRQAAMKAGINRATLYRLMERHELSRDTIVD